MDFIIVTGLSGAGKSRAVDALEDIGFYCVDNIPPKLIPVFYTLCEQAKPEMKRVAIVTDTRGGDMFSSLFETLDALRQEQKKYKILIKRLQKFTNDEKTQKPNQLKNINKSLAKYFWVNYDGTT